MDGSTTKEQALECINGKTIGKHQEKTIYLKEGPHGFYIRYNGKNFSLKEGMDENLTLEDAVKCISDVEGKGSSVIKKLGKGKEEYTVGVGRYGPYVKNGKTFANIPDEISPHNITLSKAKELIRKKNMYKAVGLKSVRKKK